MQSITENTGFTLIELMAAIMIAAILISIGVPSFNSTIKSNRLLKERDNFLSALQFSRSSALNKNKRVILCKRGLAPNEEHCDNAGAWGSGWIVFIDNNGDSNLTTADDEVLRYFEAMGNYSLAPDANDLSWIAFQSNGRIQTVGAGAGNFPLAGVTFQLCTEDRSQSVTVSINALGRTKYSEGSACSS